MINTKALFERANALGDAAHYTLAEAYSGNEHYRNIVINHLTRAAELMGYDLVKRETPQQMHEATIRRRLGLAEVRPEDADADFGQQDVFMGR